MRLVAALAIVLVALLVAAVRQATSTRGRSGPAAPLPDVEDDAPSLPAAAGAPRVAPVAVGGGIVRDGVARLHDRVLPPKGVDPQAVGRANLMLFDDGGRAVTVQTRSDGRFSMQVSSGRYELIATARAWSGSAPDIEARPGTDHEVDIQLDDGAAISGVVRGANIGDITVTATIAGRSEWIVRGVVSEDGFSVVGLVPGRAYDLDVESPGFVTAQLRALVAPANHLEVSLAPLPTVRGAFGFLLDGLCPIDGVSLTTADGETEDREIGPDCRFELRPQTTGRATITATGPGWHVEQTITIPAIGDPDPVCLNPPCRADPLEGVARLRVSFEPPGADVLAYFTASSDDDESSPTVSCLRPPCVFEALPPNRTYHVTAAISGCQGALQDIAVRSGDNAVHFRCNRERRVQGVLRVTGAPPTIAVRCTGGDRTVTKSRLFAITCAADDAALEYRVLPDGVWRSAAIPSAEVLPLVEIAL